MIFVTVQFDYSGNTVYARLLDTMIKSINRNCPSSKIEALKLQPPREHSVTRGMGSNNLKLKKWVEILEKSDETEFIFIDCDMLVIKDPSDIFQKDFDVACTRRNTHYIYNGGVVFAKKNERTIAFFKRWQQIDEKMFRDYKFHAPWRLKYAGMNQASFGYMMEKEKFAAKMIEVPCQIWNSCNDTWGRIDENTRIIHIKGGLRKACLGLMRVGGAHEKIVALWRQYSGGGGEPIRYKHVPRHDVADVLRRQQRGQMMTGHVHGQKRKPAPATLIDAMTVKP